MNEEMIMDEFYHLKCFCDTDDRYNIPHVTDCTDLLNEWVYPEHGDLTRLLDTPPRELPEYVRRFTQDIYMCVYIQQDMSMYS